MRIWKSEGDVRVRRSQPRDPERRDRLMVKVGITMLILCSLGVLVGAGTLAAFSSTTASPGNSFIAGTVDVTDDDSGTAMLSLTNAKPGDYSEGCIKVTYTGTLDANLKLYGSTSGSGLDQYLDLIVTRGTKTGSPASGFGSCSDFSPDTSNYLGAGAGVIYAGTMRGYPDSYMDPSAITDAPGASEVWTTNETHYYRIRVTVQDNNGAQGKSTAQTFTWEARNI